jgi:uncharacterized protein (DUF983 family)
MTSTPGAILRRALLLRCPRCGARGIRRGLLGFLPACPACGMDLERGESDFFLGAYLVNLVVVELIVAALVVAVGVATYPRTPWALLEYGGSALVIIAAIICYPFSKTLWLATDMILRRHDDRDAATRHRDQDRNA